MIETVSPVEQMCITRGQLKGTKAQIRSRGGGGGVSRELVAHFG